MANSPEIVVVNGIRYRREDAVKLGLIEATKAKANKVEPVEPVEEVEEATEAEEAPEEATEEVTEDAGSEPDGPSSQPASTRRKAPTRAKR